MKAQTLFYRLCHTIQEFEGDLFMLNLAVHTVGKGLVREEIEGVKPLGAYKMT